MEWSPMDIAIVLYGVGIRGPYYLIEVIDGPFWGLVLELVELMQFVS